MTGLSETAEAEVAMYEKWLTDNLGGTNTRITLH